MGTVYICDLWSSTMTLTLELSDRNLHSVHCLKAVDMCAIFFFLTKGSGGFGADIFTCDL